MTSPAPPPAWHRSPRLRAPEGSRTVFSVFFAASLVPLGAGIVFFGYRAAVVAGLCVAGCVGLEWACFRVTRTPALGGRTHALLTGVLLALTLPAFVPWYVPLVGAAFAILVGKAIFGGVGHFLWQPALVGRLAVAVMFNLTPQPAVWPVLAPAHVITGDVRNCRKSDSYRPWRATQPPAGVHGVLLERPVGKLRGLYNRVAPRYASITDAVLDQPDIREVLYGATGGGIGETCAVALMLVGLYLIYRHYVHWVLPASFMLSAAAVAAVAPVWLAEEGQTAKALWFPIAAEDWDVGLVYLGHHLLAGELLLAATLLAPETTSRPVTPVGQMIFGIGCGAGAMLLRLLVVFPLASYIAVLVMNTFTPALERITRPRVLGRRPWLLRVLVRR